MTVKPPSCSGCPLASYPGFALPEGSGKNGVMLVGESLGAEEVAESRPFVGAAGKALNRILERAKLSREDFSIANVVSCRPPDNQLEKTPWEFEAIDHCRPNLQAAIAKYQPRVIVPLGNVALRWLTDAYGVEKWRGSVLRTAFGTVVPTYHPSYIQRGNWHLAIVMTHDILKAVRIAAEGVKPGPERRYTYAASLRDAEEWREGWLQAGKPLLGFDIETPYSSGKDEEDLNDDEDSGVEDDPSYKTIHRISFSYAPGVAITMPWEGPFIEISKQMLAEAQELCSWNGDNFDLPRLRHHGALINGVHYDSMVGWHLLQPALPYNLQFASSNYVGDDFSAWKHLASGEPELYSCIDSDYLVRCALGINADLVRAGQWDLYLRDFVDIARILRKMSAYGVLTDRLKRKEQHTLWQKRYVDTILGLQQVIPDELRPRKVYKQPEAALRKKNRFKLKVSANQELVKTFDECEWESISGFLTQKEADKLSARSAKAAALTAAREQRKIERERKKLERAALKPKRRKTRAKATMDSLFQTDAGVPAAQEVQGAASQEDPQADRK